VKIEIVQLFVSKAIQGEGHGKHGLDDIFASHMGRLCSALAPTHFFSSCNSANIYEENPRGFKWKGVAA
jgi:hypothetical protein